MFKKAKILSYKDKINSSVIKKEGTFKEVKANIENIKKFLNKNTNIKVGETIHEVLFAIAYLYMRYVKTNKNFAVRFNKFLLALLDENDYYLKNI